MHVGKARGWVLLLAAVALLAAGGCAKGKGSGGHAASDDGWPKFDNPIDEGRYWLVAGVPEKAQDAFGRALQDDPENPDAHYGAMLAGDLHLMGILSLVSIYLATPENGFPQTESIDPNRDMLRQIVTALTDQGIAPAAGQAVENAAWLQANGDPEFRISGIPVYWRAQLAAELGSKWDGSERAGSQAFGHLFGGVSGLLGAIEVDLSLDSLTSLSGRLSGHSTLEKLAIILDWLDALLHDPAFPNFLKIDPDRLGDVGAARLDLGLGATDVWQTIAEIESEPGPQTDDVLAYLDITGNGAWDPGEPLVVPGAGMLDAKTMDALLYVSMFANALGAAILDRTDVDVHPGVPDPLDLAAFNDLLGAFGVPPFIKEGKHLIDVAKYFENVQPDSIRDFLQRLIDLLRPLLPAPAAEQGEALP